MNYDTLDYLIPSIRKRCKCNELTKEHYLHVRDEVRRPKRLGTKLANHITQVSQTLKSDVGISTPVDLKKINKRLLQQFSITNLIKKKGPKNNFNPKGKNQKFPISSTNVIKIIVAPLPIEAQTPKIVVKRKNILKKIHKTVSSTNSSIKNNIFSLSRGRRESHDIRETSSADLFTPRWERNTRHEELSLNRKSYAKTIISSLNMNYEGRQKRVNHEIETSPRNTRKDNKVVKDGCMCNNYKINNVLDDMNSRKNRVKIVGRLGISENDQYILNCAATVNNEPIETYSGKNFFNTIDQSEENGGIDRATQADINVCFTKDRLINSTINNKNVQCICRNVKDAATTISEFKFKCTERKSPLIVISVYPKKDTMDMEDLDDLIQISQIDGSESSDINRYIKFRTMEPKVGNTSDCERRMIIERDQNHVTRSSENRSPSPPFKAVDKGKAENRTIRKRSPTPPTKKYNNNNVENRSLKSRSRSPSVRESSKNRLIRQTSKKSIRSPTRLPLVNKKLSQKDKSNPAIVNAAQTTKAFKNSYVSIKEMSTKKNKIKKAIVDSYTQNILKSVKRKDAVSKLDSKSKSGASSSVTINIDGDNECYRVLLLQDKLNADLNIRRTLKPCNQNPSNCMKSKERGNRHEYSMPQGRLTAKESIPKIDFEELSNQRNNSQTLNKGFGFKVRDSLEIQHWREDSNEDNKNESEDYEPVIKIMHKTVQKSAKKEDLSAPLKHYRGDQCCVPNPTLRDQEIRDLLGIKKSRPGKSELVQDFHPETIGQNLNYNLNPQICVRNNSSVSHQNNSCNETQVNIYMNNQPKCVSAWTQCEEICLNSDKQIILNRNVQVQVEQFTKQKSVTLSRKQYQKVKKTIQKRTLNKINPQRRKLVDSTNCSGVSIGAIRKTKKHLTFNVENSSIMRTEVNPMHEEKYQDKENYGHEENKQLPLNAIEKTSKNNENLATSPRQVVSSMEIRYSSLAHLRHVTFSSCNVKSKPGCLLCLEEKDHPSIQTIFKGHKKCATPNLGTSTYSIYTDEEINYSDNKYILYPHKEKQKKPFLRRLMSCLVMRSNRVSEAILPRLYEQPSMMNSFDSYHINTSLAAIELTSSLYDTSASFYTNHTILPIARLKPGFLSSIRGFLTNLKSR